MLAVVKTRNGELCNEMIRKHGDLKTVCKTAEAFEIAKQGIDMVTSDDSKARVVYTPGSQMPPNYLRHSRRYCLGYCSDIRERTPPATTTIAGFYRRSACVIELK